MSLADQLHRAELFGYDSNGRRIKKPTRSTIGSTVMPVRETKPHALSHATVVSGDDEEREAKKRALDAAFAEFTEEERAVWLLQQKGEERTREETIAIGEVARYLEAGWDLRRKSKHTAVVVKSFTSLNQEEIGQRLGLSRDQVKRRIASAAKKLRAVTW